MELSPIRTNGMESSVDYSTLDDNSSSVSFTPSGSKYWTPKCPENLKPYIGMVFDTLDDAIKFYREYARVCGFAARQSTTKSASDSTVTLKYLLCHKQGFHKKRDHVEGNSNIKARNRRTARCGCEAKCFFKLLDGKKYSVYKFEERHNHFLASQIGRQFLRPNRHLTFDQQNFIVECGNVKIGAARAYRIMKEMAGGYSYVGTTLTDCKNFKRDLKAFIGGGDAQMIVNHFMKKKETCDGFSFEYYTDAEGTLCRIFWADATSRICAKVFGDIVSFDATYSSNKYNMVFVPFTGVDNHRSCVTLAAGLISNEDAASYIWFLDCFKRSSQREPIMLVTDQDPAMKSAIATVFPNSHHRNCMWHITEKLKAKVGVSICNETDFLKDISSVVWTEHAEPSDFEEGWNNVIDKYKLHEHKWLKHMYEIRASWIPVYFRNVVLGSLIRTTSRSESENSFFGRFLHGHMTLVEFYLGFDSAMDAQRHTKAKLDHETRMSTPLLKCNLEIERHAATLFTHAVFRDIQDEMIAGAYKCAIEMKKNEEGRTTYSIKDKDRKHSKFEVIYSESNCPKCSCKKFELFGIPCRHIFQVLSYLEFNEIPACLIMKRWLQNATICGVEDLKGSGAMSDNYTNATTPILSALWTEFRAAISFAKNTPDKLQLLLNEVRQFKEQCMAYDRTDGFQSKTDYFTSIIGMQQPSEIIIKTPKIARNKGCGKRIRSAREIAIELSQKQKRLCRTCGKKDFHDSRTCPMKVDAKNNEVPINE